MHNINNHLQAVNDLLLSATKSSVSLLSDTSAHILGAGGKRLRPRLVFLAHTATGGKDLDYIVPLAAAVEIIHTATLVHDDINDKGTTRRGRETVNSRWGGTFALLTGDYMFTKAYEIMVPYPASYNQILARAATELVEGETLQIHAAREGTLDRAVYYEIIAKKTASLFVAAAELGANAANAPQDWIEALRQYAFNLGLAFQITDDVLDLVGDAAQLGKTAGIDVNQGRGFAVSIGGNHGSTPTMTTAPVTGETAPGPLKESLLKNQDLGMAIERGREKASELATLAASALDELPASAARDELHDLARLVIERES